MLALVFGLGAIVAARADDLPALAQAKVLLAQGQANLVQGKAGAAAADLGQAVRLNPADAYNVLWLHFARLKENAPDATELQFNASRANRAVWPGPLLDYLTGKIDTAAVLARAEEAQGVAKARAACEAHLFLGQESVAKGRRKEGLAELQAAARACDSAPREAKLAVANLDGLDGSKPAPPSTSAIAAKSAAPQATAAKTAASVLKPASVKAEPQASTQTRAPAGDLLLRGSLK